MFELHKCTISPTSGFCLWSFLFLYNSPFFHQKRFRPCFDSKQERWFALFMNTYTFGMCHVRQQRSLATFLFMFSLCIWSFLPFWTLCRTSFSNTTRFRIVRCWNNRSIRRFLLWETLQDLWLSFQCLNYGRLWNKKSVLSFNTLQQNHSTLAASSIVEQVY